MTGISSIQCSLAIAARTSKPFMTGITILGMTLVGMFSGLIQEFFTRLGASFGAETGYRLFFLWICLCTLPSFLAVRFVRPHIDAAFGKKR